MAPGGQACLRSLDTMGNMPMSVSEQDVYHAMIAANAMAERYRACHPRA